jgi:hypothetical protein
METTTQEANGMTAYETLVQQIRDAQQIQYIASQTRDAATVGRMERLLEDLYRQQDRMNRGY